MNAEPKSLEYGEFILPQKNKPSQKLEPVQGSFVRVKPNNNAVSPIPLKKETKDETVYFSSSVQDFIFEEPEEYIPRRSDEIAKFLAEDKKSLKIEKAAIKLLKKYEEREQLEEERADKIRRPIGVKLVVIISFLLVLAVGTVTYAVSKKTILPLTAGLHLIPKTE